MKWMRGVACALVLAAMPAAAAEFGKPGLAHVRIGVTDEARAMRFYQILGMKVGRLYHPGQQEMKWDGDGQGSVLILTLAGPKVKPTPGTASLTFYTASVPATVAALRAGGFTAPDPKPATGQIQELVIQDPDGNSILLIAPAPK